MKMLTGLACALVVVGGASPLSASANVPVIPARAFAFDTIPARLDSLIARARRDTTLRVTRNGPAVVILEGQRQRLADSLPVWCHTSCVWEWDELQSIPQERTDALAVPTWGVGAIGAPAAWALGATGRGVKVASLDSGIDPFHPGYVVGGGYNAITDLPSGYQDDLAACNGHGTHVGGTMADTTGRGVAPGALLYGLKVFEMVNGQCLSYSSSQIAALNFAGLNGVRCVNISIGGSSSMTYPYALTTARGRGVVVVAANGNTGGAALYPSAYPGVLSVASIGPSGARSGFSSTGPTTELAAPGEGIISTMPGGGYGSKNGTSMAAPHVTGACALVLSVRPDLSVDAVEQILTQTADPLGSPVPNSFTGFGRVRPDRAIAALALQGPSVAAAPRSYTAPATACEAVHGTVPFTATTDATWVTVWTTPDRRVCWSVDPARAPQGTTTTPIYLAALPTAAPITGPIITVDLLTRYQTITGWEAHPQAGQESAGFLAWQNEVLDSAVAIGLNRLRLEVQSGVENPVDYFAQYKAGTITRLAWKAQWFAWVNDNDDPATTDAAAFQWSRMDEMIETVVIPMRQRLAARGESLYVNLNYVSFGGSVGQADPNEYAELILAAFQHMQTRYGFVPDGVEMILEPDNGTIWTGNAIGRALAATGPRLAAAGFRPDFIAPSTMSMAQAVPYLDAIALVPGALTYLTEVGYHRYAGVSDAALVGIATRARALGLKTAMLEHMTSGVDALLADLTKGNASAWQQFALAFPTTDNGNQYFTITNNRPVTGSRTKLLAPVFTAVRRGAVRVGSTSPDWVTAAFLNPGGRAVLVVRTTAAGAATVVGLPVGSYAVTFTPNSGTPSSTTTYAVGPLPIAFPGAGVLVVRGIP